ncbi:MAG: DegV family protein [Chloroflexi bacterium]|nr:MAG: DegV family protein [Chloroflexota bacterium]
MSIRIVTDSTADIPPEIAELHQIEVVPLLVMFGDEQFRDGVDINSERFFRRLVREPKLPTTSQPPVGAFREAYERLRDEGATEIVSIHVSVKLSRTIESARQAAADVEGVRIIHIDSGMASLALGLGVIAAAVAAEAGATVDAIEALARDQFRRTHLFIMVDTLEYLRRGGRIGRAQELIGSLLQFKPLLTVVDGEVVPVGRARTKARAIEELIRRASEYRPIAEAMAVHATTPDDLEYLVQRLNGIAPDAPITLGRVTPVIGVHVGPGVLAIAVVSAPAPID